MSASGSEDEQFRSLFERYADPVLAYARRHTDSATAEDVASETFLIACRRRAELPEAPLAWLIVVARNLLANRQRGLIRAQRLRLELTALNRLTAPQPAVDGAVVDRSVMVAALESLTAVEREAVLIFAWDGLNGRDAALVAGCSERTFNVRLYRARKRLARALDAADTPESAVELTTFRLTKEPR
ncbi:MAG: RNA polymerase sigma factor [Jatrophihabitans sp.]